MSEETRAILMKEFKEIVTSAEKAIKKDKEYARSKEFHAQKQRMTAIMRTVEGCGCDGRSAALESMFRSLADGNTDVLRAFHSIVFKSFFNDFKKLFKIL